MSLRGSTSGPSTAAFRLSASTFTRTDCWITVLSERMCAPVAPDPVKARTSCPPRCGRSSRALPTRKESAPSGSSFFSAISSMMRLATIAELVAGLLSTGMPASSATAAFSANPQAGKLNALIWIATPWRGTAICWPWKRAERPSWMPSPSTMNFPVSEPEISAYARSVAIAPSTSNLASERVLPPFAMPRSSSFSRSPWIASAIDLSAAPRSAKLMARKAGPPTVRA